MVLTEIDRELAYLLQYDPPYEWRGGNAALIDSTDPEVIAEGPAETGKTFAACYKSHMACREYPGAQGALVRKVGVSISGTVLATMKRVIGSFPVDYFGGDKNPERIIYPNGSQIWIGGMDNPTKILSGERDFFQVCQAEELSVDDWEVMTTRATGRGAVMPYTQVFGDCNPGPALHWIKARAKAGSLRLLPTGHRDNPTLYTSDGQLTAQGVKSMAALNKLTGIRRKRLKEGIWATAEGAVYENFDPAVHIKIRSWSEMKQWFLAEDEGYTNPAVILLVGMDSDGRLHIFREWYKTNRLQSAVVSRSKRMMLYAYVKNVCELKRRSITPTEARKLALRVSVAAVDEAAAGLIADLRNSGVPAMPSKGRVLDGISNIQDRLQVAGDGWPRLTVDPLCVNTINEFESYTWKKTPSGISKDEPQKEYDHAMDAIRYLDYLIGVSWLVSSYD